MAEQEKDASTISEVKAAGTVGTHIRGVPPLQSPPASPVQSYGDVLPPVQSPSQSIDQRPQLPPLSDTQLFSEPNADSSQLPLFTNQSFEDDRADSLSPAGRQATPAVAREKPQPLEPEAQPKCHWAGIWAIFPHFQSVDRDFFRRYRNACHAEMKSLRPYSPMQGPETRPHPSDPLRGTRGTTRIEKKTRQSSPPAKTARAPAKVAAPRPPKAKPTPSVERRIDSAAGPYTRPKAVKREPRERQSASAEPAARKRAPPSKAVIIDNWQQIPDYAPPTSTLTNTNRLKVAWKGVPNDISNDADAKHLHPQEVEAAQILKLPASQYLANKRRIFEARLKSIKDRKNFTKTAAQQACNIDVNKTSQLYEAYTRVGWFDESNFTQWLS